MTLTAYADKVKVRLYSNTTVKTLNGKRAACMVNVDADPADAVDGQEVVAAGIRDGQVVIK